ncbi:MAG: bifunctional DNA primase/polymerase [Gaiellaceae bacterium]
MSSPPSVAFSRIRSHEALGRAAEELARRGIAVLPLTPRGKAPLVRIGAEPLALHGVHSATEDLSTVRRWWHLAPEANIGAACGGPVVVLDIDGPAGVAALNELRAGRALGGAVVRTGRRDGFHVWFAGTGFGTRTIGPSLQLRGTGSYVVAPPSTHPSGVCYRIVRGSLDALDPVPAWLRAPTASDRTSQPDAARAHVFAPLPAPTTNGDIRRDGIRRMLEAASVDELERIARDPLLGGHSPLAYGRVVLRTACERILAAPEGSRHSALNRGAYTLGGYLAATGLDHDEATAALTNAAEAAGLVSEGDKAQTARTIANALDAGAAHPRPIPEHA